MRQALIVTNPKWERFTDASDKFKGLSGDAVLVVRGRNKEKSKAKEVKTKLVKAAAVACILFGFALNSFAQQNILSLLPATSLTPASTNYTGQGFIGWNIDDVLVFQFNVQSTNNIHVSTKSNILIYLDTALTGTTWSTNQYLISVPTHTYQTNELVTLHRITNTVGGNYLRVGAIWNANTNMAYINSAYVLKK